MVLALVLYTRSWNLLCSLGPGFANKILALESHMWVWSHSSLKLKNSHDALRE